MSTALTISSASPALRSTLAGLSTGLATAAEAHLADERPVRELPLTDLIPLVGDLLNGAALLMGYKNTLADLDDLDLMASGIAALLLRRFGSFKPAELSQAFQRGASGEYLTGPQELHQVSLPCVARWLEGYQARARAEVVALLQRQPAAALPVPRRDLAAEVLALAEQARAGRLPTGYALDFGNVLYDWLKALGAFRPFRTNAQLLDMRAEEAQRELSRARPEASTAERLQYNTFLSALGAGTFPEAHPLSRSVLNACKKRLLREWLLHHAAEATDLPTLLAELQAQPLQVFPPACPKCTQRPEHCICP